MMIICLKQNLKQNPLYPHLYSDVQHDLTSKLKKKKSQKSMGLRKSFVSGCSLQPVYLYYDVYYEAANVVTNSHILLVKL